MDEIIKNLKSKTILLVEDEMIIRENISSMLRFFFKEVYIAVDGLDGLDRYEESMPDIVMTDLKMPNMDGFELLNELKRRDTNSYTIIVSAHTDTELLLNAIHNGVDRYIVKPLVEEDLFEAFKAFLEKCKKESSQIVVLGELQIDFDKNEIITQNAKLHLNKKEGLLLKLLCQNPQKTLSYDEIENYVWGGAITSISAIRSVVRDLRKKIGQEYIKNISGVGYRLE